MIICHRIKSESSQKYLCLRINMRPHKSRTLDQLIWHSAGGNGGDGGQLEGLNKSGITAGAWLRTQDNTTKSLVGKLKHGIHIPRQNFVNSGFRLFLAVTFCVGVRNCPSRSSRVTNKQPLVLCRGKHRLADSNMSFANVQFPFYRVILYFLTFWNCESSTFRSSNVWPRLQILWWEFVWKEEFSRWLRCRLSFGPQSPPWPISNSQGYFQLIIHLCHLNTYYLDGPFFDLQDDDYHAKNPKRRSL